MFILDVANVLNNAGQVVSNVFQRLFNGGRNTSGTSSAQSFPSLGFDQFSSANRIPLIDDIQQFSTSPLAGIRMMLHAIRAAYQAGVFNASPMFRFALAGWAVTAVHNAAAMIGDILENTPQDQRNTPLYQEAQALKGVVFGLQSMLGGFAEEHKENQKGNMRIAKSMNDIAKGEIA